MDSIGWFLVFLLFVLRFIIPGAKEHIGLEELIVVDDHVLQSYHLLKFLDFLLELLDLSVFLVTSRLSFVGAVNIDGLW